MLTDDRLLEIDGKMYMMWKGDTIWYTADYTHGEPCEIHITNVFEYREKIFIEFIDSGNYETSADEKQIFNSDLFQEYISMIEQVPSNMLSYYEYITSREKSNIIDAYEKFVNTKEYYARRKVNYVEALKVGFTRHAQQDDLSKQRLQHGEF